MLTYQRNLLTSRVRTSVGSALLVSWALFCGLLMWRTAFGTDPVTQAFASIIQTETQANF